MQKKFMIYCDLIKTLPEIKSERNISSPESRCIFCSNMHTGHETYEVF